MRRVGPKLVDAALHVYSAALATLLPTPTRSHYTFNVRDLSKVFQGVQSAGAAVATGDGVVRLWLHEMLRVFGDRLIDDGDRDWFVGALKNAAEVHLRIKWCGTAVS